MKYSSDQGIALGGLLPPILLTDVTKNTLYRTINTHVIPAEAGICLAGYCKKTAMTKC